jgi:16S rRNA (cytosine967-C5)-methyltransferase
MPEKTHIRANLNAITSDELIKLLPSADKSEYGLFVTHNELKKLKKEQFIIQSLSSCIAANYYAIGVDKSAKVLDLCSAPGGKAVYLRQLTGASVIACDIHEHRVELIKSYAKNTRTEITALKNDATVFNSEFEEKFDLVIADVPCSGLGVIYSKPDLMLSKKPEDIEALSVLQKKIISTAAKYVKKGGVLCYSTCTVTKKENDGVVKAFLNENDNFKLETTEKAKDGLLRLFPHEGGCDGFFVARFRREK